MIGFMIMPIVVYIPAGIYLYHFFKRFLSLFPLREKKKLVSVFSVLFAVFCAVAGWRVYGFGAVIVLHFLLGSILMEGINFVVCRVVRERRGRNVWDIIFKSGIVSVLLTAVLMGYGYINMHQVRETTYTLHTSKTLTEDLRIAQISDLHMGTTMDVEKLAEYAAKIQEEKLDMLVLTGDIFDERTEKAQMEESVRVLAGITTRYGTYYVWGNHDPNQYVSTQKYSMDTLRSTLTASGIRVLEDEALQITPELAVVGRVDSSIDRDRESIGGLLSGIDRNSYIVLLDHRPVGLEENAAAGIDLQLSGHTHAGQIWPTGQLGELVGITEKNYGLETIDDFHAIVNSGIAGWGYAIRTGGHSEYVIVDVR